jgi:predicted transcriptional regulator
MGSGNGEVRRRRRVKAVEADIVLQCVARRPGVRAAEIAAEVGADTKDVSPVLKSLKDEGKVRSEGQARGTRYYVGAE